MAEQHQVYFKDIRERIIENIKTAEFEILIAVAWLTDDKIINELVKSSRKNVKISIIFYDDHINKKDLFKNLYYQKATIRFTKKLMHNKFCIIDKKTVINGSYNWTYNASGNHENITISLNNQNLIYQFTEEFNKIYSTGTNINSHFRNIVKEIEDKLEDFNYNYYYQTSNSYPYFYNVDCDDSIPKGYYFIKDKLKEIDFHTNIYFFKTEYSTQLVERVTNTSLKRPNRFDKIINIEKTDNKIIIPICNKNLIVVEEIISGHNYIYNIDMNGNIVDEKYHYQEKLSNGLFYNNYDSRYRASKIQFYNNNLDKTEITSILSAEKFNDIGVFGEIDKKYGLYDLTGKLLVEHKYDGYNFINGKNLIEFKEFPLFVFESSNHPNNHLQIYSRYFNKSDVGKETYLPSYYNFKMNKFINYQEIKIINGKKDHIYFFASERHNKYLYELIIKSARTKICLKDFLKLKNSNNLGNTTMINYEFDYQQKQQEYQNKLETEKIKREASNCYIATMVYKDIEHPKVKLLRQFRDEILKNYFVGKQFIKFYYKYSQNAVSYLKDKKILNSIIKITLDLFISVIKFKK